MYYVKVIDGFIDEFGIGNDGEEISEETYVAIRESFKVCPSDTETNTYKLNTDIEWVAVPKEDPDPTPEEALDFLFGGES